MLSRFFFFAAFFAQGCIASLDKHKLHNTLDNDIRLFYDVTNGESDVDFGVISPGNIKSLDLPSGLEFYAVDALSGNKLNSIILKPIRTDYYFSTEAVVEAPVINEELDFETQKQIWMRDYKQRTGLDWLSIWPRDPVIHYMWDPVEIGHKRTISSKHGFWHEGQKVPDVISDKFEYDFEMETFSIVPRSFVIKDLLSNDEVDYIITKAKGKLKRSVVSTKGYVSKNRTSSNCWLSFDQIIELIYKRVGDLLKIPYEFMLHRKAAEDLMVVYYNTTEFYHDHVDWFDYESAGPEKDYIHRGHNRLITVILYLNDPEEGGHTAFPLSNLGSQTKVLPPKGSAVVFYDMLEDGNCDYYSRHAGRPPTKGEKYIANIWIWDPEWRGGR